MNKDFQNIANQVKEHLNDPRVILGNRLYQSANHLANIEMFVFARLGLTWEQVLKYNPNFNWYVPESSYNLFVEFVDQEPELYDNICLKLNKLIKKLDKVRDSSEDRSSFRRIDKI